MLKDCNKINVSFRYINFPVVDRSEDHECQVRRIRASACEMALSSDGPYHVCVCVIVPQIAAKYSSHWPCQDGL